MSPEFGPEFGIDIPPKVVILNGEKAEEKRGEIVLDVWKKLLRFEEHEQSIELTTFGIRYATQNQNNPYVFVSSDEGVDYATPKEDLDHEILDVIDPQRIILPKNLMGLVLIDSDDINALPYTLRGYKGHRLPAFITDYEKKPTPTMSRTIRDILLFDPSKRPHLPIGEIWMGLAERRQIYTKPTILFHNPN